MAVEPRSLERSTAALQIKVEPRLEEGLVIGGVGMDVSNGDGDGVVVKTEVMEL